MSLAVAVVVGLVLVTLMGAAFVRTYRRGHRAGRLSVRAHEDSAPLIRVVHRLGGSVRVVYEGRDAGLAKVAFMVPLADGQRAEYLVGETVRGVRAGSGR